MNKLGVEESYPLLVGGGNEAHLTMVILVVVNRLELACKDAFSSSLFSNISKMLLCLYCVSRIIASDIANL